MPWNLYRSNTNDTKDPIPDLANGKPKKVCRVESYQVMLVPCSGKVAYDNNVDPVPTIIMTTTPKITLTMPTTRISLRPIIMSG